MKVESNTVHALIITMSDLQTYVKEKMGININPIEVSINTIEDPNDTTRKAKAIRVAWSVTRVVNEQAMPRFLGAQS